VAHPDETVRRVIYPVAREATLQELAKEAKAERAVFDSKVCTVLRGSYSHPPITTDGCCRTCWPRWSSTPITPLIAQ
jgi:hypothetical protein